MFSVLRAINGSVGVEVLKDGLQNRMVRDLAEFQSSAISEKTARSLHIIFHSTCSKMKDVIRLYHVSDTCLSRPDRQRHET